MRGVGCVSGVLFLFAMMSGGVLGAQTAQPSFSEIYSQLSKFSGDPYDPADGEGGDKLESALFSAADDEVLRALNEPRTTLTPVQRARTALGKLAVEHPDGMKWSADAMFHFEVLDVSPMIVVTMGVRSHEVFAAYALAEKDSPAKEMMWRTVASNFHDDDPGWMKVDVRALQRGPSKRARFVAITYWGGWAGSWDVKYRGYEWDPRSVYEADEVLSLDGAVGMDSEEGPVTKKHPFPTVGELKTAGALITLPYCIWSKLDYWDNPSLCAVDTIDMSGDDVRWVSRRYNRPDLLPLAKVSEYAEKHEAAELRAFCASDEVAKKLMAAGGVYTEAADPAVTVLEPGRERVVMGGGDVVEVEERGGRWLVVGFRKAP
jgi:hypothetical protein